MHMKLFIRVLILIVCLADVIHSPIPAYGVEPIKIGILEKGVIH